MPTPLVVPAGVVFEITDSGVRIENEGAVELHTDFGGRRILRLSSGEGVMLGAPDNQVDELVAAGPVMVRGRLHGGNVSTDGDLEADELVVEELRVGGSARVAGALRATSADVAGSVSAGSVRATTLRVGGDLRVDHDLGATTLEVGGVIEVGGNLTFDVLDLPGTVRLAGDLQGRTLRADVIELTGSSINVRGIQARTRVVIGAARLTIDAVIAPEVVIDRGSSGRVTVVESLNELGQVPFKGGFRLADYAEMFGDPAAFLAERGLLALGAAPAPSAAAEPAVAPAAEAEPAAEPEPVDAEPVSVEAEAVEAVSMEAASPADDALEAGEASEEDEAQAQANVESTDDVVSVNVGRPAPAAVEPDPWSPSVSSAEADPPPAVEPEPEATAEVQPEATVEAEPEAQVEPEGPPVIIEPSVEPVAPAPEPEPIAADDPLAAAVEHPMHPQLASTVQRIVDCYQDAELPPAVDRLRSLVDERRYTDIRAEITNIWSELLKYHQKKGIRIHHQVTTTFNSVNSLVKKM